MISYYELLTMIKNGEIPKKIEVTLCSYSMTYVPEYDGDVFAFYKIENMEEIDCNYKFYLSDSFLECTMLSPSIKIIEDKVINSIKIGDIVELYVRGLEDCGVTSIRRIETKSELNELKSLLRKEKNRLYGIVPKENLKYSYKVGE